MTQRDRFIRALRREPLTGPVPHFELVFFLTMEVFGKVHPLHRVFHQWDQMSASEKKAQNRDIAETYVMTAKRYGHSAIMVHSDVGDYDRTAPVLEEIRRLSGDEYFIMLHGDSTFGIPDGDHMEEFSYRMFDDAESLHAEAETRTEDFLKAARRFEGSGLIDGFALCSDYCFNANPFFSRDLFAEFIVPYLTKLIAGYREMGYYSIKHTDGNIMPILDQIVDCKPDALHSLDPQGGVDLAEVGRLVGDKVCLIGNVNCGLLQTGTEEEVVADVKRSLRQGMALPGYIFSTSNCIYTGLPPERYEMMVRVWREEGIYPEK